MGQPTVGSNPTLSATKRATVFTVVLFIMRISRVVESGFEEGGLASDKAGKCPGDISYLESALFFSAISFSARKMREKILLSSW